MDGWKCCENEPPSESGWYEVTHESVKEDDKLACLYYDSSGYDKWCLVMMGSTNMTGFLYRGSPHKDCLERRDFSCADLWKDLSNKEWANRNR